MFPKKRAASALMWVTSVALLFSDGGDDVGRDQPQVDSGYRTRLWLELRGPNSQRGDICRFGWKRIIINLTVKAVSFSSKSYLRGYRWNTAAICLDLLVGFFPLRSTEPRQHNELLWCLNLYAHWMRAAAVCAEFCPPCCCFWGCAAMCGLGGLTGLSCCWRARERSDIKRDNVLCSC